MTELPDVQPVSVSPVRTVGEGDVLLTIAGLRPGWYRVRDLYPRFLAYEESSKNDPPRTKIQFGGALSQMDLESQFTHGHTKVWHFTAELLERAGSVAEKVAGFRAAEAAEES
jgi:hypothetical protein